MRSRVIAVLCCAFGLIGLASPARAALTLCNRTSYVLYAATAMTAKSGVDAQGWSRVAPGFCEPVIHEDLTAPHYYIYARSSQAHSGPARAWGGDMHICVKDGTFTSHDTLNATRCSSDDYFQLPFAEIDTHGMRSWTTTLSESPDLDTLPQAQQAGLKRLLRDLGARIGAIDAKPDRAADGALLDFRKRMKLAPKASVADIFDALETEAMKSATPAGYSVCNDTAKSVAVALAQKQRNDWISHGWWKVAAGSCAKLLGDLSGIDSVYLFAQKIGGPPLVSGPNKFCVADIEFDIQGRTRCSSRGLSEVGFAETKVKGLNGFAAHVSGNGLVKPQRAGK